MAKDPVLDEGKGTFRAAQNNKVRPNQQATTESPARWLWSKCPLSANALNGLSPTGGVLELPQCSRGDSARRR
jgi:hypothetical protein